MITIFATPKAFEGQTAIDQNNAIISWKMMLPGSQIILIGDDAGTNATADRLGVSHAQGVETNELGTPRLDDIFRIAQREARYDLMMYINADIVFTHPLAAHVGSLYDHLGDVDNILAIGRRWDTKRKFVLSLDDLDGHQFRKEISIAMSEASLHGRSGLDYFIFNKHSFCLPPFLIGRPCWDNWLLWYCYRNSFSIIDCTNIIKILHQDHDYGHSPTGGSKRVLGNEWDYNVRVAGGYRNQENSLCVTHRLAEDVVLPVCFIRRICFYVFARSPLKTLLSVTRYLRYRRENI